MNTMGKGDTNKKFEILRALSLTETERKIANECARAIAEKEDRQLTEEKKPGPAKSANEIEQTIIWELNSTSEKNRLTLLHYVAHLDADRTASACITKTVRKGHVTDVSVELVLTKEKGFAEYYRISNNYSSCMPLPSDQEMLDWAKRSLAIYLAKEQRNKPEPDPEPKNVSPREWKPESNWAPVWNIQNHLGEYHVVYGADMPDGRKAVAECDFIPGLFIRCDLRLSIADEPGGTFSEVRSVTFPLSSGNGYEEAMVMATSKLLDYLEMEMKTEMLEQLQGGITKPEPKNGGTKFDDGKIRWDLLPLDPLEQVVLALMHGADKYGIGNWEKGYSWRKMASAGFRHFTAWLRGQKLDPDSGLNPLAHVGACVLFLLHYDIHRERYKEFDDRFINEGGGHGRN